MSVIEELIQGAIDIHVHFGPDPRVERRSDAIETAQRARELGMRALVLKSHEYPTQPVAATVSKVVPDIQLIGSVCMDEEVGGLNACAAEASARMGARVVWMPTFYAAAHRKYRGRDGGVSVTDQKGRLTRETREVLEVIRAHDLVLATGHVSINEVKALVERAREMGIGRVVVTHASHLSRWYGLTVEEMKALASQGAFLEHAVQVMMPLGHNLPPRELVAMVQGVGAEHCILSTDFGQAHHPIPPEGLRMGIGMLLQAGLSPGELGIMVKRNPARLLGLD